MSLNEKYAQMRYETLNDIALLATECRNAATGLAALRKRLHSIMESGFICGVFPAQAPESILLIWHGVVDAQRTLLTAAYAVEGVLAELRTVCRENKD